MLKKKEMKQVVMGLSYELIESFYEFMEIPD